MAKLATVSNNINSLSKDHPESQEIDSPKVLALKRLQANPRVKYIVVVVPSDACPVCQKLTGTYLKNEVPALPSEECSRQSGCQSYYLPYLDEIYP